VLPSPLLFTLLLRCFPLLLVRIRHIGFDWHVLLQRYSNENGDSIRFEAGDACSEAALLCVFTKIATIRMHLNGLEQAQEEASARD
jgi:hypothetical protein